VDMRRKLNIEGLSVHRSWFSAVCRKLSRVHQFWGRQGWRYVRSYVSNAESKEGVNFRGYHGSYSNVSLRLFWQIRISNCGKGFDFFRGQKGSVAWTR